MLTHNPHHPVVSWADMFQHIVVGMYRWDSFFWYKDVLRKFYVPYNQILPCKGSANVAGEIKRCHSILKIRDFKWQEFNVI